MSRGEEFRRFMHADRDRYIIYVLWLVGFSQEIIARTMSMRKTQIAGIIDNSDYSNRAAMTDELRQAYLDELEAIRFDDDGIKLDGGSLDQFRFRIRPLGGRQKRGYS